MTRAPKTIAMLVLATIAATGCDRAPATPAPRDPLNVIATAYPLADVVRIVGDRAVHVEWLAEAGQSLDSIELTPGLQGRLRTAELVVSSGSEPWAVEGVADALRTQRVLRLDSLETANSTRRSATALWVDPVIMREFINVLAERLGTMRPDEQPLFRRNADALIAQIDATLGEYRQRLDRLAGTRVIVLSPDLGALTARWGLVEVRPVAQPSPARLSDADIALIRQAARENGARTLLINSDTPAQTVQDLASRTSLNVLTIDLLGTSGSQGTGGGHTSFLGLMHNNLDQLVSIR